MKEEALSFPSENSRLSAIWHHASSPQSSVLLCHHGFTGNKIESHRIFVKLARRVAEEMMDVFRFDFYGSGDSDGTLADATLSRWRKNSLDAVSYAASREAKKNYLLGFSVGGFVSSANAPLVKPAGLILWAPIFHPLKRILREKELVTEAREKGYANYQGELVGISLVQDARSLKIPKIYEGYQGPVLLLQGSEDETVSLADSRAFKAFYHKQGVSVEFHLIAGANHSFDRHDWETEVIERTLHWLKKVSGAPGELV